MASVLDQTLKYQVSKLQSFIHDTRLMWGPPVVFLEKDVKSREEPKKTQFERFYE